MLEDTFGKRLRAARKKIGMSVSDIADRLNISTKTVYGWENDNCFPGTSILPALSRILETSLDELFGTGESSFVISETERKLVEAYRDHPEMRKSVLRLFELEDKE